MSVCYCALELLKVGDVFGARLEKYGICERRTNDTSGTFRCLTDGRNCLWAYCDEDGLMRDFECWGSNSPARILNAISYEFDIQIISEYDPEYRAAIGLLAEDAE
jgi:hypothetical protein